MLDSRATELVMSLLRSRDSSWKKIKKPIYIRNLNRSFNKKGPIKYIVEVNIYYQWYRKRTEIDVIGE